MTSIQYTSAVRPSHYSFRRTAKERSRSGMFHFGVSSFLLSGLLFLFAAGYVLAVSAITNGTYALNTYENQKISLEKEHAGLLQKLSDVRSLENISQASGIFSFEEIGRAAYIEMKDHTVVAKK